nr:nucleotidyltransferase family protein [Agrobacterium tumefaciens]
MLTQNRSCEKEEATRMDQLGELRSTVLASPLLRPIIDGWDKLALPDCWLVAGAIAQTVWNKTFDLPSTHGISDVDIVYFDPDDLTEKGEVDRAARIRAAFSHLPVWIDVKNEARVHTWYETKFGYQIAPYTSTAEAITTFPTTATAIGLKPTGGSLLLDAPFGTDDLMNGVVRPNKKQITREIYDAKTMRWITVWPNLSVVSWEDEEPLKS